MVVVHCTAHSCLWGADISAQWGAAFVGATEVVVVSGGAWALAWAVEEHYNAGVGLVTGIGSPSWELLIGRGSQHGGSVENCICSRYVIFSKASPLFAMVIPLYEEERDRVWSTRFLGYFCPFITSMWMPRVSLYNSCLSMAHTKYKKIPPNQIQSCLCVAKIIDCLPSPRQLIFDLLWSDFVELNRNSQ